KSKSTIETLKLLERHAIIKRTYLYEQRNPPLIGFSTHFPHQRFRVPFALITGIYAHDLTHRLAHLLGEPGSNRDATARGTVRAQPLVHQVNSPLAGIAPF